MDKEKKKIILIVTGVILVIVLACLIGFTIVKKNTNKETAKLKDVLNDSLEILATVDSDKRVELYSMEGKENIDKVEIWVFSDPIYLGEFNLVKTDDKYYLEGLEEILKTKDLKAGNHRLLLMNDGKSVGYIKIEIADDKSLKSTPVSENVDDNAGNNGASETPEENNNTNDNSADTNKDQTSKTENNKNTSSADSKKEETTKPANKVDEVKEEPKKEETTKEEPKQEEVKCTPKKFKNKYTYFYEDKDTCVKNGDQLDAWDYFRANGIPATNYGCEEIVDECGNTYYGVYYGNTEGGKFYY